MEKLKTVSLCMIVKNEEKFLAQCLNSVKDIIDEFIIVDTGSTDNTVSIANSFGAKVYFYTWNNNFSAARNFSLSKATKDWILLMDGDDVLDEGDKGKVINLINTSKKHGHFFNTLSVVKEDSKDYLYNLNIRLIRNTGEYEFEGAIHEQITHKFQPTDYANFTSEDIRIYHRGYIPEVSDSKKKRERNIGIIKEELKKYPNSSFHNFNLASEYFALMDMKNALIYYDKAYHNMSVTTGYATKLVLKRALCLIEMKEYDKAIDALEEGLSNFKEFTDLQFYKGYTYHKAKKYTLALKSYNKALELGEAPIECAFLNGCGSFRAYHALGDIYLDLEDYEEAILNYKKVLDYTRDNNIIYYQLGTAYKGLYSDSDKVVYELEKNFNLSDIREIFLLAAVLINIQCNEHAIGFIEKASENEASDISCILMGKALFNLNKYNESFISFSRVSYKSIYYDEAIIYLLMIKILEKANINEGEFALIKDEIVRTLMEKINMFNSDKKIEEFTFKNSYLVLSEFIKLLDILISAKEFEVFEKLLPMLNYINNEKILVELSKLYYKHGFKSLAVEEAIRSIKELGVIDEASINILYKEI